MASKDNKTKGAKDKSASKKAKTAAKGGQAVSVDRHGNRSPGRGLAACT